MSFEEQINLIRKQKHEQYLKYASECDKLAEIEQQPSNELLPAPAIIDPRNAAAITIQRFVRRVLFEPPCINSEEILGIEPIYRLRIFITNYHINEYSEQNVPADDIETHRTIYQVARSEPKVIFFRYCFDIRKLHPDKNQIVELYDNFYFMQPEDHRRIDKLWARINGATSASIKFLNNFEYAKSLAIDKYRDL